jgi:transglutaminase-like putative cysteine protease
MRNTATLTPVESGIAWPPGQTYTGAQWQRDLSMDGLSQDTIQFLRDRASAVTQGSTTQLEAVERIITFLRANVSYRLGTSADPRRVLETGAAYCEGYANAAVYLLRAAGIPAREMTCYIPKGKGWGFGNAGGYHAFVEVAFADAGWLCSDPQDTINFADPFHLVNLPHGLSAMGIRVEDRGESRSVSTLYREPPGASSFLSL